jgi:ankyrin repeat protein
MHSLYFRACFLFSSLIASVLPVHAQSSPALPEPELVQAVKQGDVIKVQKLLAEGADPNMTVQGGWPLLVKASAYHGRNSSYKGNVQIVRALLDRGAKVDATAADHRTALMEASRVGYVDIVGLLIARKANLNSKDIQGYTALIQAVRVHQVDVVKLLLKKGANVNIQTKSGITALETAVRYGYPDEVNLLIANKAEVNLQGMRGLTPLALALSVHKQGHDRSVIIALLKKAGAKE